MFHEEVTKIGNAIGLDGKFLVDFGFDQIMSILSPPPEMETVDLLRWESVNAHGLREWSTFEDDARMWAERGQEVIKLSGTFQRPKPQKVTRSVSVQDIRLDDFGRPLYNISPIIEFTEASGKTVTITATWTE